MTSVSGNDELDKKIKEWLDWDQVSPIIPSILKIINNFEKFRMKKPAVKSKNWSMKRIGMFWGSVC
jgi:hypothetical protein